MNPRLDTLHIVFQSGQHLRLGPITLGIGITDPELEDSEPWTLQDALDSIAEAKEQESVCYVNSGPGIPFVVDTTKIDYIVPEQWDDPKT